MKRIASWLLVASFTFILGVAAALLGLEFRRPTIQKSAASPCAPLPNSENASVDSPILAYCELANNPERYNGKVVRVSARLSGFIHGILFYDPNCLGGDTRAAVFYNPENREEIKRSLNQARGSDDWLQPVDLIAVGRFKKVIPSNESDTIYDTASLQFEIMRIEKAYKAR